MNNGQIKIIANKDSHGDFAAVIDGAKIVRVFRGLLRFSYARQYAGELATATFRKVHDDL